MEGLKHSIRKLKNWYNSNGQAENQGENGDME